MRLWGCSILRGFGGYDVSGAAVGASQGWARMGVQEQHPNTEKGLGFRV